LLTTSGFFYQVYSLGGATGLTIYGDSEVRDIKRFQ